MRNASCQKLVKRRSTRWLCDDVGLAADRERDPLRAVSPATAGPAGYIVAEPIGPGARGVGMGGGFGRAPLAFPGPNLSLGTGPVVAVGTERPRAELVIGAGQRLGEPRVGAVGHQQRHLPPAAQYRPRATRLCISGQEADPAADSAAAVARLENARPRLQQDIAGGQAGQPPGAGRPKSAPAIPARSGPPRGG